MAKLNIRKDDKVVIISGKDKGKEGKVLRAFPETGKVVVQGANMVVRHKKPRSQKDQGGLINQEAALDASNVMLVCAKCGKATRIARKVLENGKRVRVCKHCNETFND